VTKKGAFGTEEKANFFEAEHYRTIQQIQELQKELEVSRKQNDSLGM
jgi:hypothetical protein